MSVGTGGQKLSWWKPAAPYIKADWQRLLEATVVVSSFPVSIQGANQLGGLYVGWCEWWRIVQVNLLVSPIVLNIWSIFLFIHFFLFPPLHTLQRTEQYKLIYQLKNYTGYGRRPWTGVPPTLAYAINWPSASVKNLIGDIWIARTPISSLAHEPHGRLEDLWDILQTMAYRERNYSHREEHSVLAILRLDIIPKPFCYY